MYEEKDEYKDTQKQSRSKKRLKPRKGKEYHKIFKRKAGPIPIKKVYKRKDKHSKDWEE